MTAAPGVLDLYRAIFGTVRASLDVSRRRRLAIAVEITMVAAYVVLRTADAGRPALFAWTAALIVVALVSPATALVPFVAVAPYSEWLLLDRDTGLKLAIIPFLALGVAGRLLLVRPAWPPPLGWLTLALWAGSGASVIHSFIRFGTDFGQRSIAVWAAGIGGGLVVFATAWWAARGGSLRPLFAAAATIAVAGAVSLLDHVADAAVRRSVLAWMLRPTHDEVRLAGIIPAPNAVAGLLLAGTAVLVAVLIFSRDPRRVVLLPAIAMLGIAVLLTFSRSGIFGAVLIGVAYAAWWRPRAGLIAAVVIVGLSIVIVPLYLNLRAGAVGSGAILLEGSLLSGSDMERLNAWASAVRMWLDAPLTGVGFLGFKELHAAYGSPTISAPHNELLRVLVEAGLVVAVAFAWWAIAVVTRLWRKRSVVGIAGVGAFLALVSAASYNNPLLYIQVVAVVMTIVGAAVGWSPGPPVDAGPVAEEQLSVTEPVDDVGQRL